MNIIDQLIAEVQDQIDDVKPMTYNTIQPDAYTHGWYNGNFVVAGEAVWSRLHYYITVM
jgi:hypothetical protein